jgi:hypothetical protein
MIVWSKASKKGWWCSTQKLTRDDDSEDRVDAEKVGKEPAERPGAPRMKDDEGDESLAVQLLVQARDGLIPIETFAVANEDDLVLIN